MTDLLVSVVIPVYNPGDRMDPLLRSLRGQTLAQDRLEIIAVDDGSTDGAAERLARAAQDQPNLRVERIPGSGWPGRPRNVGTDLARGRYVFYSDQDDELFPEALERMAAQADRNQADIVYGKVVRTGRHTPYWPLAHRDLDRADLLQDHLLLSRTTHKLYRRSFLNAHDLRFAEGRVRLEDHRFMAQALPVAGVVSVLASYPCYVWHHRNDGSNNSSNEIAPAAYWGWYSGVQQELTDRLASGPVLDAALANAAAQAFTRFPPSKWMKMAEPLRESTFQAVHEYLRQHAPPSVDPYLPSLKRLRVQALRDGDRRRFDALQEWRTRFGFDVTATGVRRDGDVLTVGAQVSLRQDDGEALVLPRAGDGLLLPLPPGLASQVTDGDRRLTEDDLGGLEITVRHRASGVEWPVAGSSSRQVIDDPDGAQLAVTSAAVLDPANLAFGAGLAAGTWDVLVREQFLGESITRRLPVPAQVSQPPGGRRLAARLTPKGTLAVVAAGPGQTLSQESGAAPTTSAVVAARWCGDTLHLRLDHGSRPDVPTAAVQQVELRRRDDGGPRVRAALRAVPGQGGPGQCEAGQGEAVLRLPDGERGQIWDGWLLAEGAESTRLRFEVPEVAQHRPYRVYRTAHGSFSIKQTAAGGNR